MFNILSKFESDLLNNNKPKKYKINNLDNFYVIGFYNPKDSISVVDKYFNAGDLGNFPDCSNGVSIDIPGYGILKFNNSEGAFQALKFHEEAKQFIGLSGFEVFKLKKKFDITYPGRYGTPEMMYDVLIAKFKQNPVLANILLATEDAFLIEHTFRDAKWGNNGDGTGENILGLLLIKVRYLLNIEKNSIKLPIETVQFKQYNILPPPFINMNVKELILKGTNTILNIIKNNN